MIIQQFFPTCYWAFRQKTNYVTVTSLIKEHKVLNLVQNKATCSSLCKKTVSGYDKYTLPHTGKTKDIQHTNGNLLLVYYFFIGIL